MPAPQMIETPTMRRSAMLAKLLEEQRQPVEIKGGYGELAARLLGQGITQFSANRAERAVRDEREATREAFLAGLPVAPEAAPSGPAFAAALVAPQVTNTQEPQQANMAPVAPIMGSALPDAAPAGMPAAPMPMADVPPMPQMVPAPTMAPTPPPMAPQASAQPQMPPQLAAYVRQLAQTDLPGAQAVYGNWQQQQAMMSQMPESIRNDPMMAWLAATNPEEFTKAVSQQYSPQVIAEGGSQRIAGTDQTYRNPRTFLAGGDIMQTAPDGVRDVGNVSPTYGDLTSRMLAERPVPINTAPGATTSFMNVGGDITGQIQGAETPEAIARRENMARADTQARSRALQVIGNTTDAISRAREQTSGLSAGVLSGLIPMNQWRANLAGTIETIQANLSFTELAQMRAASPTGGALGSIAVKELELLGATVASLNQNQSPQEFARSLDVIDGAMDRWKATLEEGPAQTSGPARPQNRAEFDALPSGTTFIAPDGTTRRKP
jgi:hypothetical protein